MRRWAGRMGLVWLGLALLAGGCSTGKTAPTTESKRTTSVVSSAPPLYGFDGQAFFRVAHDDLFIRSHPHGFPYPQARYVPVDGLETSGASEDKVLVTVVVDGGGTAEAARAVRAYLEGLATVHAHLRVAYLSVADDDGDRSEANREPRLEDVPMTFVNGIAVHGADLWALERAIRGQARVAHGLYSETKLTGDALYEAVSLQNASAYAEAIGHSHKLDEGCDAGALSDCVEAGRLWFKGRHDSRDWDKAAERWSRACNGGDLGGCLELASHLGRLGRSDELDAADRERFRQACEAGNGRACSVYVAVGMSLAEPSMGLGQALAMVERGCELDDGESCTLLGQILVYGLGEETRYADGVQALEKACRLGDGEGCMHAAGATPDHLPRARERSRDRYETACMVGIQGACGLLAELLGQERQKSAQATLWIEVLYRRECRDHHILEFCAN
jgi:TPR repeat protein